MFHIGRCGSGVLGDLLAQNPAIAWEGELLKPRRFHRDLPFPLRRLWPGAPLRDRAMLRLVRDKLAGADGTMAYGFETKFFHLEREGVSLATFLRTVEQGGVDRYVILRRRNLLRIVASGLIAARAGHHHASDVGPRPDPIVIDPGRVPLDRTEMPLVALLERWDHQYADLERRLDEATTLSVFYEDDVAADPSVGYRKICTYLGVDAVQAEVRLRPTNPYPLDALVANLDEVQRELEHTKFGWMVDA